ncbi:MAG: acyl-CoA thioester hydrolase [Bacteroidetes bacterium]|nr:MAG: acyl-CoA thioester hydrolase [Bacteroidota bacterium]
MEKKQSNPSSNHRELPADFLEQFHHSADLQIRFNDVDRLDHVNNSIFQQFFDLGRLRYFEELLKPKMQWDSVVVVVARIEIDFIAPLHLEDTPAVATRVHSIKPKTFHMQQAIYDPKTRLVYAVADSLMVGFDTQQNKSHELLDSWVEAMERFEAQGKPIV